MVAVVWVQRLQFAGGHRGGQARIVVVIIIHSRLARPQTGIRGGRIQGHRGYVVVRHHLENYVLISVTERRAKRICRIS